MRVHRFFVDEPLRSGEEVVIHSPEITHQWKNVFRFHTGNQVILLDNTGQEFLALIEIISIEITKVRIIEGSKSKNIPKKEIYLFAALIKKDNFEWILEKGTELGVSHFIPILADRSEKKDINKERGDKIICEAAEQSERGILPKLYEPMTLDVALEAFPEIDHIAFHLDGKKFPKDEYTKEKKLGIHIGPEGGWSEREVELFVEQKIPLYTTGPQVLKAETAAIAVASLLLL